MALEQDIWSKDISENLYQNNLFMNRATDHSMWVAFKTVHVPQAGSAPAVYKNRAVLPATISQRTDSELTYNLSSYTSDPVLVTNLEELQISYSKRMSVISNTVDVLGDVVSNQTLYAWAPTGATRQVRTSGTADGLALAPSATGTRKAITLNDIAAAKSILDIDNVPQDGRVLLMPASEYNSHFLAISNVQAAYAYGAPTLPSGVVNRIFGFDIMMRPAVLVYDNTATPVIKAIDADGTPTTEAATDNMASLAYHPKMVAHALGSITSFYEEQSPLYYGNIYSAELMHGASKLRTDQKGIVAIIQAA
jgi:hypothetical protein